MSDFLHVVTWWTDAATTFSLIVDLSADNDWMIGLIFFQLDTSWAIIS